MVKYSFDLDQVWLRVAVPLPSGRYKLEESLWQIQRMRSDVEKIRQIVCKDDAKPAKAALASIAPEERAPLIKRIPRDIADVLGKYNLPGIAALTENGVPKRDVAALMKHSNAEASRLLAAAEKARSTLTAGIKTEYNAMRVGGSHVTPLLDDAETLVRKALRACDG